MDKLNTSFDDIEKNMSVDENTKSLLQGTIDAGVNGGLPKYKVNIFSISIVRVYFYSN